MFEDVEVTEIFLEGYTRSDFWVRESYEAIGKMKRPRSCSCSNRRRITIRTCYDRPVETLCVMMPSPFVIEVVTSGACLFAVTPTPLYPLIDWDFLR